MGYNHHIDNNEESEMKLRYMGETDEQLNLVKGSVYRAKFVRADESGYKAFKVYHGGSLGYGLNVYVNKDGSCYAPGVQDYHHFELVNPRGKTHLKMLVRAFRKIGKRWLDSKKVHTTWSHKSVKSEWPSEIHWAQCQAFMYVGSDNRITDDFLELIELEPGQKLTQHDVDAIVAEDMSNW